MKNRIIAIVFILSAAMLFAAGGSEASAPSKTDGKIIIYSSGFQEALFTGSNVSTGGADVQKELAAQKNITLDWFTAGTGPAELKEAMYRVGLLPKTEEDLIFVDNNMVDNRIPSVLEPLDDYLKNKPLEGYPDDYSKSMQDAYTVNGKIYAIPWHVGVFEMWYNQKIFEERGIKNPPTTPEELYEIAKQCTYTKPNGEKVYGFSDQYDRVGVTQSLVHFARMYGGDLISEDGKILINQPPVVKGLELLKRMVQEGITPSNWGQYQPDAMIQQGQFAIAFSASSKNALFNDPEKSKDAGHFVPLPLPLAKELQTPERNFSGGNAFIWAIGILKGSDQKDAAWELIRFLHQKDIAIQISKNGNTSSRLSVLEYMGQTDPGMKIQSQIMKYAKTNIPAYAEGSRIMDIIAQHVENACLGGKDAQAELDLCAKEIEPLVR
jgi:ABC-type glycerol-3-phosphate transport system substrate-binding protein